MDSAVGRVVAALETNDLRADTLVVLSSDNGPADVSSVDCDFIGSPGPFQGLWQRSPEGGGGGGVMKGTLWEGGHRVVSIASWPGTIRAKRVSEALTSTLDLLPTFLSIAGSSLPSDRSFDGMDLSLLLKNDSIDMSDILRRKNDVKMGDAIDLGDGLGIQRVLYHQSVGSLGLLDAMRIGRYKFVFETGGTASCGNTTPSPPIRHMPPLVFDVYSDPAESTTVSLPKNIVIAVLAARGAKLFDIYATLSHKANMKSGSKLDSACCDRSSSVCRCPWQETSTS